MNQYVHTFWFIYIRLEQLFEIAPLLNDIYIK